MSKKVQQKTPFGYIYKITNKKNNKIYIGQSIRDINKRFQRHICDALSGRLNTHLARAIRKHGAEHFSIEILDTANSQKELTKKEKHYIVLYNSTQLGYNETDAELKTGGNTYKYKSKQDMKKIRDKISKSKLGSKNPNSTKVKCKNINTGEELFFDSMIDVQKFFCEPNHVNISRRCRRKTHYLYRGEWLIAYSDSEYPTDYTTYKHSRNQAKIKIKEKGSKTWKEFPSYASAERYYKLKNKTLSGHAHNKPNEFKYENLTVKKIKKG